MSPGLPQELAEGLESSRPSLGPELQNSLPSAGETPERWTVDEFNELLREYGYRLHHVFPQEFEEEFEQIGIDVHEWTYPMDSDLHTWLDNPNGGNWNSQWEAWLDKVALPKGLGPYDAADFAESLFKKLNVPFDPVNLRPY